MKKLVTFAVCLTALSSLAFAGGACPDCSAPEIDTNLAAGTLIVIGGAVLLVRSRLRR